MEHSQYFPYTEINALTKPQGTSPESFQWPKTDRLGQKGMCVVHNANKIKISFEFQIIFNLKKKKNPKNKSNIGPWRP